MEPEEGTQLTEAQHIESMLNSDGWKAVFKKLEGHILDLQNINNLDLTKPDTLSVQLAARKMAVDAIWAWLKNDVHGAIEQAKVNAAKVEEKTEGYIGR